MINTDRSTKNPAWIKVTKAGCELITDYLVGGWFFKCLKIEWCIFCGISYTVDWLNFRVIITWWLRIIMIIALVFEFSCDIMEIESIVPYSGCLFLPTSREWICFDLIPILLYHGSKSSWNGRITLSPFNAYLWVSIFGIGRLSINCDVHWGINWDGSLGLFALRTNNNCKSIISVCSKSRVSASINGVWLIERIKDLILAESNSMPSICN